MEQTVELFQQAIGIATAPTQYQLWNFIPFKSYEPQSFDESGIVIPSLLSGYEGVRFQHTLE
jgi:hypothetical protein